MIARRIIDITIWLIPALALLLAWQLAAGSRAVLASLAEGDGLAGFYPPETGDLGAFRWAGAEARLELPGAGLPGVVTLRGAVAPGSAVELLVGDAPPLELPPATVPQIRRFRLLTPARPDPLGRLAIAIRAAPAAVVDGRALSLALAELSVLPAGRGPQLPPLGAWLILAGLPALLAGWLWLAGAPARLAGALNAGLGLALAALWATYPAALDSLLLDLAAFAGAGQLWLWWLLVHLAAVAVWPLVGRMFGGLPLRGAPLAPILGLLLVGWAAWVLAVTGLAPFGPWSIAGVWAVLGVAAWGADGRRRAVEAGHRARRSPPVEAARRPWSPARLPWRALLCWEALLVAGLLAGCWLRWHGAVGPALSGTEKPMELAILGAVVRYERFPPPDPWLAGYGLNYYYLGYVLVGALAELSGAAPEMALNLGFALTVGLTVIGVAFAAYALAHSWPGLPRRAPAVAAVLALLLALVVGSQASALQLMVGSPLWRALDAGQLATAIGQRLSGAEQLELGRPTPPGWDGPPFATIVPQPRSFDWFTPSRTIYDDVALPGGGVERRYAINEFPAFSLFLGDLHPHILAMPFGMLALALGLVQLPGSSLGVAGSAGVSPALPGCGQDARAPAAQHHTYFRKAVLGIAKQADARRLRSVGAGFLVGCLYCLNAWDAPSYGLLLAGGLAFGRRDQSGRLDWPGWLADLAAMAGAALLAALPFLLTFTPPAGPPRPGALDGLPLIGRLASTFGLAANRTQLHSFLALFALFLAPILAFAAAPRTGAAPLLRLGALLAALLIGPLLGFPLLFLAPLAALLAWRAWQADSPGAAVVAWAGAVGALALLVPELVYIRDQLEGEMSRMITVFKFVFQGWLLWAVVAALAAVAAFRPRAAPLATLAWAGPGALLLAGALLYPLGLVAWAEPWRPAERSFDGLAFLAREAPDELAAARWLAAEAAPDEIVLTGFCNCDYEQVSRPGATSAVQTLLGWMDGHERVWRSGDQAQLAEIARREADIPRMFAGDAGALELMRAYGVDYLYVGPLERRLYPAAGLAALDSALIPAFQQGQVTIYRLPATGPEQP